MNGGRPQGGGLSGAVPGADGAEEATASPARSPRSGLRRSLPNGDPSLRRIPRRPQEGYAPTSFGQLRLWFAEQLAPHNIAYNTALALIMNGPLDVEAFGRSLTEIVRRHETLRTTFAIRDAEPVQIIHDPADLSLPIVNLGHLQETEQLAESRRLALDEARHPFDLVSGPLIRAQLLRLGETRHVFLLTIHHIVTDGWSMRVLFREIRALYPAFALGADSPLGELRIQYADYAAWQRYHLHGGQLERELSYWREQLAGAPTLDLPTDRPRPPVMSQRGGCVRVHLSDELADGLERLSRECGTTLFMTLVAAFKTLLARYSGQNDIVIGSSVAGRNHTDVEGLIGFFVNTVALRTDMSGNPSFREVLARVREVCLGAYAHQEVPFERVVDELAPERDPSRTPLFQVLFQGGTQETEQWTIAELDLDWLDVDSHSAKFDLLFDLRKTGDGLRGKVDYNADLFDEETIERMLGHYRVLLEAVARDPELPISRLPLLTADEYRRLQEWNATEAPYPRAATLHELFEQQAAMQPDADAVVAGDTTISYSELDRSANRLAWRLRELGVRANVPVGIAAEWSAELAIAILGILKAGGAYVPLDPAYPKTRLAAMVGAVNMAALVVQPGLERNLPDVDLPMVRVGDGDGRAGEDVACRAEVGSEDLAYVIFTSGSTGQPKGVMLDHRGRVNNFIDYNRRFAIGAGDRILVVSSPSFDICAYNVLGGLAGGATIVMPDPEQARDPRHLVRLLVERYVTVWHSVPALLTRLVDHLDGARASLPELRLVLLGGDWIPVTLPERIRRFAPAAQVVSLGGATEVSVDSIVFPIERVEKSWTSVPYGRPMANQTAYVLDPNGEPAPTLVTGELHLGGVGLAWGYWGQPGLTADKFVPNPFSRVPGDRLYRTGDLARHRGDGNLELLGRIDSQVKIRGVRIELGEVEAALRSHPSVDAGVVTARQNAAGEKELAAYAVTAPGCTVDDAELRRFLAELLPTSMVPSVIMTLDALPLTPNGKLDRRALPAPETPPRPKIVAPRDEDEERLVEIWRSLLGVAELGIDDDFFALGGDSFTAIRAVRTFSDSLPIVELFKHPTVRAFAERARADRSPAGNLLRELTRPRETPRLSLVCVPYAGGNAVAYAPLADALSDDHVLYAVGLPGHDYTTADEELCSLHDVVASCVDEILRSVFGPLVLYGQCAGAALTLELARQLEERERPLQAVYVGAALPNPDPWGSLQRGRHASDEDLLAYLEEIGGLDGPLDGHARSMLARVLRHDLSEAALYFGQLLDAAVGRKLRVPLHCVLGENDPATGDYSARFSLWGAFAETTALTVIPRAGHFFNKHQAEELARIIEADSVPEPLRL